MSFRLAVRNSALRQQLRSKSTQANAVAAASDFFSSIRWKAASVLTSSLSESEKNELFKKLQISDPVATETPTAAAAVEEQGAFLEHSIAEAVAKARAEEAQKQQAKWEQEREQLTSQAEQAARARIEQELAIHEQRAKRFQEWTQEVNEATKDIAPTVNAQVVENQHPVLGPVISDFGYKRVHSVPAQALSSIAVWKKQRTFRHDRAKSMAKDKLKSLHLGFPGVIVLHEVSGMGLFDKANNFDEGTHVTCYCLIHAVGPRRQPQDC